MDSAMFYTHAVIWCLGAIVAILALSACALWLAWHVYKEAIGWPTIVKAMKLYRAAQEGKSHDN